MFALADEHPTGVFDFYSNPSIFARKVLLFDRKILKRVHRLLRGGAFRFRGVQTAKGVQFSWQEEAMRK